MWVRKCRILSDEILNYEANSNSCDLDHGLEGSGCMIFFFSEYFSGSLRLHLGFLNLFTTSKVLETVFKNGYVISKCTKSNLYAHLHCHIGNADKKLRRLFLL